MGGRKSKPEPPPKSRITEQDKAVLQLKQMRDKLKQYQNRIETQLSKERELARTLVKEGKVEKAKTLLKKKKYFENNLARTDAQLDNLDQMCHNLEFTQIEQQVIKGLKTGNECLKNLQAMISLDEVEQIMDDTREAVEYQRKIDELISGQFSDEAMDEINAELDGIINSSLPEVPADKLPTISTEKEPVKQKERTKKIAVEAN